MRVLAIDPGLTRCGIAVVEGEPGRQLSAVYYGVLRTPAGDDISRRLLAVDEAMNDWIERFEPQLVACERVFSRRDVSTIIGTAQASGVVLTAAARNGIPVALHTPTEVKAAVSGSGRADKAQVTAMVTRLLRLPAPPKPADTADALALAICACWRGASAARLDRAQARAAMMGKEAGQ